LASCSIPSGGRGRHCEIDDKMKEEEVLLGQKISLPDVLGKVAYRSGIILPGDM